MYYPTQAVPMWTATLFFLKCSEKGAAPATGAGHTIFYFFKCQQNVDARDDVSKTWTPVPM